MRLDRLALVATLRNDRRQHKPINDIMKELTSLQTQHNFKMNPAWVRRCYNKAADALSKDDMPRFWANIQGNRSKINLSDADLALPKAMEMPRSCIIGGIQRLGYALDHERRPVKEFYTLPDGLTASDLAGALRNAVATCQTADKAKRQNSGINHYKKFCARSGYKELTPATREMRERILPWMIHGRPAHVHRRARMPQEGHMWLSGLKYGLFTTRK
jgi:hypothetical protein